MSFPVSSLLAKEKEENHIRRCDVCEEWKDSCFFCKVTNWKKRFFNANNNDDYNLSLFKEIGDNNILEQIQDLEYLLNNPLRIMQPRSDGTFAEQRRRPNGPSQNEPLAQCIMSYGDSILPHSREMALEIFVEGLYHHNSLPALNVRVMLLLIEFDRDAEAMSFVESLSQWPTMRFVEELWFKCCDGDSIYYDEITGVENLSIESLCVLIIIKAKIIARLKENLEIYNTFQQKTGAGQKLEEVQIVIASFLGITSFLDTQQEQFKKLSDIWNRDVGDMNCTTLEQMNLDHFHFKWDTDQTKKECHQSCKDFMV